MGLTESAFDEDGCHDINYFMISSLPGYTYSGSVTVTINSEEHAICAGWTAAYFDGSCETFPVYSSSAYLSAPTGEGSSVLIAERGLGTHKLCVDPFSREDDWRIEIFVTPQAPAAD